MEFINHNNVDIHLLKDADKLPINNGDYGDDEEKSRIESLWFVILSCVSYGPFGFGRIVWSNL